MEKRQEQKTPKVTVCVVTYNQEQYIEQCLQSIVDQEVEFDLEVIVGDDCSTDSTRDIIQKFSDKYSYITPLLREKNTGAFENYINTHARARGEYISHVDGDDFLLRGKLQAQVDILDRYSNVSYCAHSMKILRGGNYLTIENDKYPEFGSIEDLLKFGTYFNNSSIMYRKKYEEKHSSSSKMIDYYLHLERATKGLIYYLRDDYGVYRDNPQGISKNEEFTDQLENAYELSFDYALHLGVNKRLVEKGRARQRMSFALSRLRKGDFIGYRKRIKLEKEKITHASIKHIILHLTRYLNSLLHLIRKLYFK